MAVLLFPKKWSEANTCQFDLATRYLILLHNKSCPDPPPWHSHLLFIIYLFLHWLKCTTDWKLSHSLHFKYQWMQLLALEYSKDLFECVQASYMLPFVRVTRLCGVTWMEIFVCSCCSWEEYAVVWEDREGKRNEGKEKQNDGNRRMWSRCSENFLIIFLDFHYCTHRLRVFICSRALTVTLFASFIAPGTLEQDLWASRRWVHNKYKRR